MRAIMTEYGAGQATDGAYRRAAQVSVDRVRQRDLAGATSPDLFDSSGTIDASTRPTTDGEEVASVFQK